MKQKVLIWYFRLQSTTHSIMKVGEKGHYLQTEVMIILKADRKKHHACSYLSMLSFGRTGTSCRKFNLFVTLWRSNINLRNCKFDFQYHCLPAYHFISIPMPFQILDDTIIHMCWHKDLSIYTRFNLVTTFHSYELRKYRGKMENIATLLTEDRYVEWTTEDRYVVEST